MAKRTPTPLPPGTEDTPAPAPRRGGNDQTESTGAVRVQQVRASVCVLNKLHTKTRIYATRGKVRFCECLDPQCNARWKQTGPPAGSQEPPYTDPKASTPCPGDPRHPNTRCYQSGGGMDSNVCDDCGKEWQSPTVEVAAEE